MRTPCADPVLEHADQRLPQRAPVRGLEVEGVDVLVLLGRVLGVLDAAVGTPAEPFRVLADPGVVGRALEGDVERDLQAMFTRALQQALEVGQGAELVEDGVVSALGRTHRPRAADVVGTRVERVVAALAPHAPDRVDGREVDDVEAHALHVGQPGLAVGEAAVPAGHTGGRARKEFVPARAARPHPLDRHRIAGGCARAMDQRVAQVRKTLGNAAAGLVQPDALQFGHIGASDRRRRQFVGPGQQQAGLGPATGARGGFLDKCGTAERGHAHVVGVDAPPEVAAPGQEGVDPGADRIFPAAQLVDAEAGVPAVVAHRQHRRARPRAGAGAAPQQHTGDDVVTVGQAVGFHPDRVAEHALDRKPAVVDGWRDALDDDTDAAVVQPDRHHRLPGAHAAGPSGLKTSTPSGGKVRFSA
jgi:hypothetical protein